MRRHPNRCGRVSQAPWLPLSHRPINRRNGKRNSAGSLMIGSWFRAAASLGAGASEELTLFNCYVIPSPHDSRGGIMQTLSEMTEIMARGGGVGINLSSLRPRRAIVKGVNGSSSGAVFLLASFITNYLES